MLTAAATWVEFEVSVDPVEVKLSVVVLVDMVELSVLTAAVTLVVLEVVLRMVEVEIGEDSAPPVYVVVSPLLDNESAKE